MEGRARIYRRVEKRAWRGDRVRRGERVEESGRDGREREREREEEREKDGGV